jgi:hypothetical protein
LRVAREELEWVDVAEATARSAHAEVEPRMTPRGCGGSDSRPGVHRDAFVHVDARERQLRHAPWPTDDRDDAAVAADSPRDGDPTAARCLDDGARTRGEVDAPVLTGGERAATQGERARHRSEYGSHPRSCGVCGDEERKAGGQRQQEQRAGGRGKAAHGLTVRPG